MKARSVVLTAMISLATVYLFGQTRRGEGPDHHAVEPPAIFSPFVTDEEDGLPFHGPLVLLTSPCTIDNWSKVVQWDGGSAETLKHLHDPNPTTELYTTHVFSGVGSHSGALSGWVHCVRATANTPILPLQLSVHVWPRIPMAAVTPAKSQLKVGATEDLHLVITERAQKSGSTICLTVSPPGTLSFPGLKNNCTIVPPNENEAVVTVKAEHQAQNVVVTAVDHPQATKTAQIDIKP